MVSKYLQLSSSCVRTTDNNSTYFAWTFKQFLYQSVKLGLFRQEITEVFRGVRMIVQTVAGPNFQELEKFSLLPPMSTDLNVQYILSKFTITKWKIHPCFYINDWKQVHVDLKCWRQCYQTSRAVANLNMKKCYMLHGQNMVGHLSSFLRLFVLYLVHIR